MSDAAAKFRDYATRISFNLSLSRNQVGHLAGVVMEIENEAYREADLSGRIDMRHDVVSISGGKPNLFVSGRGSLERMGLVTPAPGWIEASQSVEKGAFWKYQGPTYLLTPAGEHIVELLRIAGLIPKAAANSNKKRKKKVA